MNGVLAWLRRPTPEQVVRDHAQQVHRHLRRIFGPAADLDDIFQTVFVEVIRSLPDFRGHARLSTWIRRITWNVAYQEMRQNYRRPALVELSDEQDAALPFAGVGEVMADRQSLDRLYAALHEMDPGERLAVVLHDVEGFTLKEIGSTLGRPLQTVASRLHAGRAHLAEGLRARLNVSNTKAANDGRKRVSHDGEL